VSVWISRTIAILAALFYLAVIIPNIMPRGWPANLQLTVEANGRDPYALAMYVGLMSITLACIFIGQRRSRLAEGIGWTVLLGLLVLACV